MTTREQFYEFRRCHRQMRRALGLECGSAARLAMRAAIIRSSRVCLPLDVARDALASITPGLPPFPSLSAAIERQRLHALSLAH